VWLRLYWRSRVERQPVGGTIRRNVPRKSVSSDPWASRPHKGCCPLGWQRRIAALGLRSMPSSWWWPRLPFHGPTLSNSLDIEIILFYSRGEFPLSNSVCFSSSVFLHFFRGSSLRDYNSLSSRSLQSCRWKLTVIEIHLRVEKMFAASYRKQNL